MVAHGYLSWRSVSKTIQSCRFGNFRADCRIGCHEPQSSRRARRIASVSPAIRYSLIVSQGFGMNTIIGRRSALWLLTVVVHLVAAPAFGQVNLSGVWNNLGI